MKRLLGICLAVVLVLGLSILALPIQPAMADPGIIYVSTTGDDITGDGTAGNPYQTIGKGISMATSGDTVQVAAGTYYENITLKSGVIVQGVGAGVTTIDGGGSTVVHATSVGSAAKLDGFTITNGFRGIYNYDYSSPTITNNTITGNAGDGIFNYNHSSPTITNNTITGNTMYGIYNRTHSSPTIDYNDVWGNSAGNYSGPSAGPNDISQDPLFVNPGAGDYHLQSGSPAIDAGDNAAAIVAGLTTDFEGDPRIMDGDGNSVAVVDMGADEYYVSLVLVTIDIKPGSDPNSINLKGKGVIPVAILTTPDFDATTVDASTVTFGPGAATMVHKNAHLEDVDSDGDIDMVLHFKTQDTGISAGDTEATLTGETYGGTPIEGSDIIRVK